tara:strand:+ start:65 stop:1204 length:1140 start_codon:yes stop_codon:yes gene_type:complete
MDNSPEAVKGRVRSMTKAIRYKARKEGNLMKAFNDYMGSQSGISATERSAVKSSLGLSENKWRPSMSDWRSELTEVAPMTDKDDDKKIKEKKIKNKIIINPTMGMKEAIEAIGGTIMEVSEIEEESKKRELIEKSREKDVEQGRVPGRLKEAMSPKEVQLQKKKTMLDMQIARDRRKQIDKAGNAPTKEVGEGYAPGDIDQKVGAVTAIPKKDRDAARDRLLAKAKAKREKMKEETADLDQMQKDADANRARAAKLKDRNVTRGSAALAARAVERDVKKAAKTGPQQYPNPGKGVKKIEKPKPTHTKTGVMRVEETEDSLRDKRMERGGVDGNTNYKKPAPKFASGPSKKKYDGMRAVDRVRDDIIKQYGKGALINKKK